MRKNFDSGGDLLIRYKIRPAKLFIKNISFLKFLVSF